MYPSPRQLCDFRGHQYILLLYETADKDFYITSRVQKTRIAFFFFFNVVCLNCMLKKNKQRNQRFRRFCMYRIRDKPQSVQGCAKKEALWQNPFLLFSFSFVLHSENPSILMLQY